MHRITLANLASWQQEFKTSQADSNPQRESEPTLFMFKKGPMGIYGNMSMADEKDDVHNIGATWCMAHDSVLTGLNNYKILFINAVPEALLDLPKGLVQKIDAVFVFPSFPLNDAVLNTWFEGERPDIKEAEIEKNGSKITGKIFRRHGMVAVNNQVFTDFFTMMETTLELPEDRKKAIILHEY